MDYFANFNLEDYRVPQNADVHSDEESAHARKPVVRLPSIFKSEGQMGPLEMRMSQKSQGVSTGVELFDDFLLWKGLPKGDLTLLYGKPGSGATSLWLSAVKRIHEQSKWAAWINSDWELLPSHLLQNKIDLRRLLVVRKPGRSESLFAILQELLSSGIFEMVGCHLPETLFKNHQLQKLKRLARTHKVALVLVSHAKQWAINPLFSLVIDCAREFFTVRRALHRPTPFTVEGNQVYASFGHSISGATRALLR